MRIATPPLKSRLLAAAGMAVIAGTMAFSAPAAYAGKSDDTLNVGFYQDLENIDPYFASSRESVIMSQQIWDGLVYYDPQDKKFKGNLATDWKWIDDTTIDFTLRQGVTFHNGEEFDADDVVYTINFIADPKSGVVVQRNVNWLKSAEKLDKYKVRIHLKAPTPAAFEFFSNSIPIYPNDYYAKVGPKGMALKPVGTGPYEVTSLEPGKHYVLKRFDKYFDGPKGHADIGNVDIRTIPDTNTRLAELFSGSLDFTWNIPADLAEKLKEMGTVQVLNGATMRIGYLTFDAAARGGKNPFTDVRVRQALSYAIDRQAIVKNLVKGASEVVNTACYPSQFGCDQDVTKYSYDPKKAKELLKEAGYPDGFSIDFYAYRNRPYAEAMISYMNAVGIKANLKMLQYSALRDLHLKGQGGFSFMTWGSYSVNDVTAITSQFFKEEGEDFAMDDEVKNWLQTGDSTVDQAKRKEAYSKALKKIAAQAYWLPLFSYNTNYALTSDATYTPTVDGIVRFFKVSWK